MKKSYLIAIVSLIVLVFSGCQKDNETEPEPQVLWSFGLENGQISLRSYNFIDESDREEIILPGNVDYSNTILVYNPCSNSMIVLGQDGLYSISILDHGATKITDIDLNGLVLKLDVNNQLLYGIGHDNTYYDLFSLNLINSDFNILLPDIFPFAESDHISATLDADNSKFYFSLNDTLYSYDISDNDLDDKIFVGSLVSLEYNSVTKELNGISDFQFVRMNTDFRDMITINFRDQVSGYSHENSTINTITGDYIFLGHDNIDDYLHLMVCDRDGHIKIIEDDILTWELEFQSDDF